MGGGLMLPLTLGRAPRAPLRILCLGAHSDDIEIGCGGAVLQLLAEYPGSSVHWVVFSANPEREIEARASANEFLAGAAESVVTVKTFRESFFPYVAADIKEFFEEIKRSVTPISCSAIIGMICTKITAPSPNLPGTPSVTTWWQSTKSPSTRAISASPTSSFRSRAPWPTRRSTF